MGREQPKEGDSVLHCGHMDGRVHVASVPEGARRQRCPDGEVRDVLWLLACDDCYMQALGDWRKVLFYESASLRGNSPILDDEH